MAAAAESVGLEHLSLAGLPVPLTLKLPVPFSDDDLIAFSRKNRPYRIERNANGELEIMSPVGFEGGQRELFVMRVLGNWAEQHGGLCVSSSAGFLLPDASVRSPDASWISDARYNALSSAQKRGFPPLCPEFLVDILSATDRRPDLEEKMDLWMASGAELAWMIDPFAATVTIYRPGTAPETLDRPEAVEAWPPVAGFRMACTHFWQD